MATGGDRGIKYPKAEGMHVQSPGGWGKCNVFLKLEQFSGQDPGGETGGVQTLRAPVDLPAHSRLHASGNGESMKRKQRGGAVRNGFAFHKEFSGGRIGNRLQGTSMDVDCCKIQVRQVWTRVAAVEM